MATDVFKYVPSHITYLFVFLCTCQVLLLLHIGKKGLQSSDRIAQKADVNSHHVGDEKIVSAESLMAQSRLHNGKLRLLWSFKQAGNSNEGGSKDASVVAGGVVNPDDSNTGVAQADSNAFNAYTSKWADYEEASPFLKDYNFEYVINQPFLCHSPRGAVNEDTKEPVNDMDVQDEEDIVAPPYMLVLVHSHPSHKAQRDAIRDTWGMIRKDYDSKHPVRIVFIVGLPEADDRQGISKPLKEAKLYKDIVLGNFTDTYHNLTLKSLFGLQWAVKHCPEVRYVMKTDDDVYFNLSHVVRLLSGFKTRDSVRMLGSVNANSPVQRRGLWQVSDFEFPNKTYPPYCSGCAYVLSRDVIESLLGAAQSVPMLPIEDVYVTGILANVTGTACRSSPFFPHWYYGPSPAHICALLNNRVFGLHNVPYDKMYFIDKKVKSGHVCGA